MSNKKPIIYPTDSMQLCKPDQDSELLAGLKRSEEAALVGIYKKYWHKLYCAAHTVLNDSQICEDVVQDLFINLWRRRQELTIQSLSGYLHSAVRYEVFRQIKHGKVHEDIFQHIAERIQAGPGFDIEYKELHAQIHAIVEQLPAKCKEVYKLSREENLSHKQIADKLQISTKTVENHLTKALAFLRVSLGQVLTIELISFIMRNK